MVDHEVAEILAEIKRRVTSKEEKSASETYGIAESSARAISTPAPARTNDYANLTVMARAWDRLPPLVSKRTGNLARLDLWFKSKLKRASRWFTWEQVNFNAAAYQTFVEMVESLNAWEQQLVETNQQLEAQREQLKNQETALSTELSSFTTQLIQLTNQLEQIDRGHLAMFAQLNARVEGLAQMAKELQEERQTQIAEPVSESNLQYEKLLDEQRVCFKQLSLELSESRVLQDRARRELEMRVARLEEEKR